jgi:hypothetical protein
MVAGVVALAGLVAFFAIFLVDLAAVPPLAAMVFATFVVEVFLGERVAEAFFTALAAVVVFETAFPAEVLLLATLGSFKKNGRSSSIIVPFPRTPECREALFCHPSKRTKMTDPHWIPNIVSGSIHFTS